VQPGGTRADRLPAAAPGDPLVPEPRGPDVDPTVIISLVYNAPLTLETSASPGPDGEGLAKGKAPKRTGNLSTNPAVNA